MNGFSYVRAASVVEAARELAANEDAKVLAGGTNLLDLMKYNVEKPTRLIDITRLPLNTIQETENGGLRVGALVSNADLAYDVRIEQRYPLLASALLAGASPQLRNAATTGGNLLQRTRCYYFYDPGTPCNKREPGTGCSAIEGVNRIHAILGASEQCIATHPSDMCVALAALDAQVHVTGPQKQRIIPFAKFHRLPGDTPQIDTNLARDEVITAVELPPESFDTHYTYLKLRDRLSYAFALVSVAVALRIEDGMIREARIALGGVAHKPWRDPSTEKVLRGKSPECKLFARVAGRLVSKARGYAHNEFKIEMARRAIHRALTQAAAATPQSQTDKRVR